jgi:hypothetical protein
MKYEFSACGHENIIATHKTTFEFTQDRHLSLKGDCIIGTNSDFNLKELKEFIKKIKSNKVMISITALNDKIEEKIFCNINSDYHSEKELVVRKTDFISYRTFGIKADKSAFELRRDLIDFLQNRSNKVKVILEVIG